MYSSFARRLNDVTDSNALGNLIKEFRQNLHNKLPSFEEFQVNFRALEYKSSFAKSRNIIRYTLSKIDEFKNKDGAKVDYKASNIEHILPQSPKVKLAKHEEYVGSVENLILINPVVNSALANKDFVGKKAVLLKCGMYIDDVIKNATDWNEAEINERTDWLANVAYYQVFKVR